MSLALSIIILSTVIALGKLLGRCKIFGISLGVTWILFVGIIFSHFGFNLDPSLSVSYTHLTLPTILRV